MLAMLAVLLLQAEEYTETSSKQAYYFHLGVT